MFSVLPVPTATVPSYPGQNLEGSSRRLTERKKSRNSSVDTPAGDAGMAFTLFYFSAVLIVLVGIDALVGMGAICGRASAGTTPDTADHYVNACLHDLASLLLHNLYGIFLDYIIV